MDESKSDFYDEYIDNYFDEVKNTDEDNIIDWATFPIEKADSREGKGKLSFASLPESEPEQELSERKLICFNK